MTWWQSWRGTIMLILLSLTSWFYYMSVTFR